MPQVAIYLTMEEYAKFLKEAQEKGVKINALITEKIRGENK